MRNVTIIFFLAVATTQAQAGRVTFDPATAETVTFSRSINHQTISETVLAGRFLVDGKVSAYLDQRSEPPITAYCVDLNHQNGFTNDYRLTSTDLTSHQFAGQRYADSGNRIAFLLQTSPVATVSQSVALQIALWTCVDSTFRVTAINGQAVLNSTLQFIGYDPLHRYDGGLLLATHDGDRYQDLAYAAMPTVTPEPTPTMAMIGMAVVIGMTELWRKRKRKA
jgi:hypothetical protein